MASDAFAADVRLDLRMLLDSLRRGGRGVREMGGRPCLARTFVRDSGTDSRLIHLALFFLQTHLLRSSRDEGSKSE